MSFNFSRQVQFGPVESISTQAFYARIWELALRDPVDYGFDKETLAVVIYNTSCPTGENQTLGLPRKQ